MNTMPRASRRTPHIALPLKNVIPIRMLAALGVHIRAERDDLDRLGASILDQPGGQCEGDPAPAQRLRHLGVIGDDQMRIGAAVGQLVSASVPSTLAT